MTAPDFSNKVVAREDALQRVKNLPQPVVFTNGVFDVLHRGHVTYLAQARALGASLVVALNTDASARRLGKGDDRPLNNEQDRAWVMAALESVSLVTWFDEDTPLQLIRRVRPHVLVKGGDYKKSEVVGHQIVERAGGEVILVDLVPGQSTTRLVERAKPASNKSASNKPGGKPRKK